MTRFYIGIFTFFFFIFSIAFSGQAPVRFGGTIHSIPSGGCNMILEYFAEDGWKNMVSKVSDAEGKFSNDVIFDHSGQYRLRLSVDPDKWMEFIIDTSKIPPGGYSFEMDYKDIHKQVLRIDSSKEYDAYSQLMTLYHYHTLNPDSLDRNGMQYQAREKQLTLMCEGIKKEFPETYTAKVLSPLLSVPLAPFWNDPSPVIDSLVKFNALHAFDNVPFSEKGIVYHIGFIRKLNLAFNYYLDHGIVEQYIDKLMTKSMVSDEMEAFMFRFMLDKMIDNKNEIGLSYLITWYSHDCAENDLVGNATKDLIKALENCKPGNNIELLRLPDVKGNVIPLADIMAKNKITILLFWKSNCNHCKEFHPKLEEIYGRYHDLGVEVYAIGTDKSDEAWRTEVSAHPSPWPDVFLEYGSRKDFNKRFPVPSTPTLIAVDDEGKILRRLIMRSKLEEALEEMLLETR